jgi:hypothetical protein
MDTSKLNTRKYPIWARRIPKTIDCRIPEVVIAIPKRLEFLFQDFLDQSTLLEKQDDLYAPDTLAYFSIPYNKQPTADDLDGDMLSIIEQFMDYLAVQYPDKDPTG